MSAREIAQLLGQTLPEEEKPTTPTAIAKAAHDDLDGRVERWIDATQRRPGETSEKAYSRVMGEQPALYAQLQKARDAATRANGIGREFDAAPLGARRAW
jgi:hypothetical protein